MCFFGLAEFRCLLCWFVSPVSTTAVYINGHCMVKGYGRFDGR
nr:MAG TPA: hypothetical protein [Bacteriophage sp.]